MKSDDSRASEKRLYVVSMKDTVEMFNRITRQHWSIESMHWCLDRNLQQDGIKCKTEQSPKNLDTVQRLVLMLIAVWKNRRKKAVDKRKGVAEIIGGPSASLTRLLHFLIQKK